MIKNMRLRPGISLVECLLYVMLTTMVIMLSMSWIAQSHAKLITLNASNDAYMSVCALQDLLARDLRSAPSNCDAWKEVSPGVYVWRTEQGDLGWELQDEQMRRIEGIYDEHAKKWGKHHTSVIANGVYSFTLALRKSKGDNVMQWEAVQILINSAHNPLSGGQDAKSVDRTLFFRLGRPA